MTRMEYTDGRDTPYQIMCDRTFFDDDLADASMRLNPASCVVAFDLDMAYLEDVEILEIAERIKAYQANQQEQEGGASHARLPVPE